MTGQLLTQGIPLKILCIDDDPYLTDLLEYVLRREGYQVIVATDGATGLHLVRTDQPDLVLLDLYLPDMDGLTVCAGIRRRHAAPIILLTACDNRHTIAEGLRLGADEYIAKPFRVAHLLCRIQAVLRRATDPLCGGPRNVDVEGKPPHARASMAIVKPVWDSPAHMFRRLNYRPVSRWRRFRR